MPDNKTEKLPELGYLESEISEFCNLNCKGCADFSNLAKTKSFYEFDEFSKDMRRLTEIFGNIKKIRLMGGEPLLNPRYPEYVCLCRELFPSSDIRIVSNGLLIPTLRDEDMKILKENGCKFDISNYPPTRKLFPEIKKKLDLFEIEYDLGFPMNYFFRNILAVPSEDPVPAFKNCIFTHCHMLSHGKLSPCSYAHCIGRLNEEFSLNYPETDTVDIYSDISGEEIIKMFSSPHEFCKCCGKGIVPFKWKGGVKSNKAKAEDWLIKDSFINTKVIPVIQTAAKPAAMALRNKIQNK